MSGRDEEREKREIKREREERDKEREVEREAETNRYACRQTYGAMSTSTHIKHPSGHPIASISQVSRGLCSHVSGRSLKIYNGQNKVIT